MIKARTAKFQIGQIVRHRVFSFRGVIFDIDPEFNNTEEWWLSIPEEVRPHKDQPFYHLLGKTRNPNTSLTSPSRTWFPMKQASRSDTLRLPRSSSRISP